VAFSPDQTLIAVGRTRSVDLLDAGTGQLTRRLTPPLDDDDRRVVFSSDNRWLATTVRDNRLQLWDYRDQTATAVDVSDDVIESGFAILPGGKRIISVMSSPQLRAYALDQQPDGKWVSTELDLSECASPQSVSPGSESFSASWKARACTYPSTGGHSVEIWSGNRATEDIVWSAGGRSFAEIMSHELIVGRQLQSGRTESWIKGVHPTEANERSRLISVSEDGARVALIDDDEHKLVRIISVADHKPFLSRLPADQMALAPDTSFMAVVKPAVNGKGAVIEVLPIAEQTFTAVHKRTRIAVDVAPLEIHATNHSIVVVRATDPPTTTAFDATTGRRQFEPLTGVGRPVGSRGELLLVQPVRGDQSRVVRTRDGASVAQWRRSIGEPLVWVSPAKTALAIRGDTSYDPPLDRVLVYTVSNEDLSPMGQVVMSSQKLKSAARVLEVADDGRSIGIVGSNGPVWPVRREETDRPTRATERDRVADSISPLGRYQVEDEAGRIRVVRRADKAVLKRFQASVRSDFSRDDPWLFSRDDRWLVVRSNNDLQLLDLARGEIAFALATGNGEIETIAFEGGNRLLRIQLEEDESRTTMLVPLNVGLLKKFTAWLTPRTLTSQERCLYGFGGKECRSEIAPPRGIGPAAR
jgi:hypothetical protein